MKLKFDTNPPPFFGITTGPEDDLTFWIDPNAEIIRYVRDLEKLNLKDSVDDLPGFTYQAMDSDGDTRTIYWDKFDEHWFNRHVQETPMVAMVWQPGDNRMSALLKLVMEDVG